MDRHEIPIVFAALALIAVGCASSPVPDTALEEIQLSL